MNGINESGSVQAVSLIDYKFRDHEEHIESFARSGNF